jgi:hypothetical protein
MASSVPAAGARSVRAPRPGLAFAAAGLARAPGRTSRGFAAWPAAAAVSGYARAREDDLFAIVTGFVQSQILFAALKSASSMRLPMGRDHLGARPAPVSTGPPGRLVQAAQSIRLVRLGRTALSRWPIMAPSSSDDAGCGR